jgi:hypothetical protein
MTVPRLSASSAMAGWTMARGEKSRAIQQKRPRPRAKELRDERAIVICDVAKTKCRLSNCKEGKTV